MTNQMKQLSLLLLCLAMTAWAWAEPEVMPGAWQTMLILSVWALGAWLYSLPAVSAYLKAKLSPARSQ
jgi:hypothetical protein